MRIGVIGDRNTEFQFDRTLIRLFQMCALTLVSEILIVPLNEASLCPEFRAHIICLADSCPYRPLICLFNIFFVALLEFWTLPDDALFSLEIREDLLQIPL